jgi:hypothetical protein
MSKRITISSVETPRHRAKTVHGLRQFFLMGAAMLAAILPISILVSTQPAGASGNVSFIGNWKVSGGYLGFTIKSENLHTGACAGRTASSLYHLIACRVTGNKYVFTITEGVSYRSHNTGTISGNRAVGRFSDSNGTVANYTAVR